MPNARIPKRRRIGCQTSAVGDRDRLELVEAHDLVAAHRSPQLLEHDRIDRARRRRRAPRGSRSPAQRRRPPRARRRTRAARAARELGAQLVVDLDPSRRAASSRRAGRAGRRGGELVDRRRVVVDAQVDEDVGEAARSRRRARRRAAPPTAGRGGRRPRPGPRRGSRAGARRAAGRRCASNVAASASTVSSPTRMFPCAAKHGAGAPAGPVDALRRRCSVALPPVRVDDAELPLVAAVVGVGRAARRPPRRDSPLAQQREPVRPVARVRVRLGRDRADVRLGPRHDRADREELRLRRDAPLAGVEVAGGDRVRRDDRHLAIGQLGQVELEQRAGR